MKVEVSYSYPVTRHTIIEIPDELANEYKDAYAKDDKDGIWETSAKIYDYLESTIPQIATDADYEPDIYDWEEVK